jgi:S1-C subfamily serine protease
MAVVLPVVLAAGIALPGIASGQVSRALLVRIGIGGHAAAWRSSAPASTAAQGYLGIGFRDVSDDRLAALKLKEPRGVEIIHVDHDGPASQAGLLEHDVILQLNGQPIEGEEQLRRILRETPVGRAVNLVVSRDGLQITVSTQMADRTAVERRAWEQHIRPDPSMPPMPMPIHASGFLGGPPVSMPPPAIAPAAAPPITAPPDAKTHAFLGTVILGSSYTGAALEMIGPQLAQFFGSQGGNGLLVRSVEPNSPAATAGMRAGDVVVRANAIIIAGTGDWSRLVHENRGRPLSVVVVREKQEQTLVLIPDAKKRSSLEFQAFPLPDGTPSPDRAQAERPQRDGVN